MKKKLLKFLPNFLQFFSKISKFFFFFRYEHFKIKDFLAQLPFFYEGKISEIFFLQN